ncbi:MAG: hypothetical protein ISS49_05735 [Anaerolineae bacterium]|nr:hypothetical protein [Anaerolineae bacterium]
MATISLAALLEAGRMWRIIAQPPKYGDWRPLRAGVPPAERGCCWRATSGGCEELWRLYPPG